MPPPDKVLKLSRRRNVGGPSHFLNDPARGTHCPIARPNPRNLTPAEIPPQGLLGFWSRLKGTSLAWSPVISTPPPSQSSSSLPFIHCVSATTSFVSSSLSGSPGVFDWCVPKNQISSKDSRANTASSLLTARPSLFTSVVLKLAKVGA